MQVLAGYYGTHERHELNNNIILEINKNLKLKKGVGIAIKSKETSSKLAI